MRSQLPSAHSLKSMWRRRDEGPPPALRGTSPSPSEGGEPPTGHSLIWLDKLFFLLSSRYLLKTLTLFIKVPHTICSTSPPYLFNIPTLSVQHLHLICSTSPPYLLYSYTPSTFVIMSFCLQKNIYLHLSLCHYVLKKTSHNICHYVILSKKVHLSPFVIMSLCLKKNICLFLSLCHSVFKKTSVSHRHYVILS